MRGPRLRLFLLSFLMLFVELALIRWTASDIVYLSYFTNFVLLGSFLGIGTSVAVGVGLILLGLVFLVFANVVSPRFFGRRPEVAPPGFLERPTGPAVATVTPE